MSPTPLQIVKWSFPTLAVILGFFWYRRRRADRVDPGGIFRSDSDNNSNNIKATKRSTSLCDSDVQAGDSYILSTSCPSVVDETCSPRRISCNLDIPGRKPAASEPISIRSVKSIEEKILWYEDEEDLPEPPKIKLGSNPRSNCFDMMLLNNRSSSFFENSNVENDSKLPKICNNIIEEDQVNEIHSTGMKEVTPGKKMNISNEGVIETCEKSASLGTNEIKTQALSERDSANHSPVSGVTDGSLPDEARSEGSTDSGKGIIYS